MLSQRGDTLGNCLVRRTQDGDTDGLKTKAGQRHVGPWEDGGGRERVGGEVGRERGEYEIDLARDESSGSQLSATASLSSDPSSLEVNSFLIN